MHTPPCRTLLLLAALAACGCSGILHRPAIDYSTVVADPLRDEDKAIAQTKRAAKFVEEGDLEHAEQSLQRALVADVGYGPAHNNLGTVYFLQGKYYLAAWEYEYACRLMPNRAEPFNNLGMVLESAARIDQAIENYSMAHRLAPRNPVYIGNLARAYIERDDAAPEALPLLSDLLLYDTRCDWTEWANERLARAGGPVTSSVTSANAPDQPLSPEQVPLGEIWIDSGDVPNWPAGSTFFSPTLPSPSSASSPQLAPMPAAP